MLQWRWDTLYRLKYFIASTLPVTRLLQPRDYINAWQLFVAMGLLVFGVLASGLTAGLHIVAPAVNLTPSGAPPIWPFLFITIACGAISGFHALVASGTSSKQVAKESDALFVGYGAMLIEAALATLVIIAVAAGIGMGYKTGQGDILTGTAAWQMHYSSWTASSGLGAKISAVVTGSANMIAVLGIPKTLGMVIMGVFIASFAGTTLDSATRIQRYVVTELFTDMKIKFMTNKYAATAFAVITAAALAFASGADGKGALKLWPMFGAINQLLAALTLLVITIYFKKKGGYRYLVSGLPCVFMLMMTIWAVVINQLGFLTKANWLLAAVNGIILALSVWMIIESVIVFGLFKKLKKA
jgi:carbon starvation protein